MNRKIAIAPMMDWTDRHYRYFMRHITRHTLLYTEMVTSAAILHGDRNQLLQFNPIEHPIAAQIAGCEPKKLAECASVIEDMAYDELNLNVGCPSERVQAGRYGACLMAEPDLVAECVAAMQAKVAIPVTVKTRIGVDDKDTYEHLHHFVNTVANAGCHVFIIHARKAWLKGLSPKENRSKPPLQYELVHQLKNDFPNLQIIINGGLNDLQIAKENHADLDGIMVGREAYHNPYSFATVDRDFFNDDHLIFSRDEVIQAILPFIQQECDHGVRLTQMTRHLLGLFQGMPGARQWRRHISENAHKEGCGIDVLLTAAAMVSSFDKCLKLNN